MRPAFPGFPSDRLRFPRLQLRGSAGFSPASLLVRNDEGARTKEVVKEQTDYGFENLLARGSEVNRHEMAPVWRGRPRPRLLTLVLAIWKIGFPALETL